MESFLALSKSSRLFPAPSASSRGPNLCPEQPLGPGLQFQAKGTHCPSDSPLQHDPGPCALLIHFLSLTLTVNLHKHLLFSCCTAGPLSHS